MTATTRVLIEGDPTAAEAIAATLRSAGLCTVDVELVPRQRDVTALPVVPGSWAGLADVAPELPYADWRHEMLSIDVTAGGSPLRSTGPPGSGVAPLRRAV